MVFNPYKSNRAVTRYYLKFFNASTITELEDILSELEDILSELYDTDTGKVA